jgi:dTDP-L-rhamnose 4-epimerase
MGSKVLVTGGAGFIGSHTVDQLLAAGYEVRVMDNLSSKTHLNKKWPTYLAKDTEKVSGDVRSAKDWKIALKGVRFVVHLAAWLDLTDDLGMFSKVNTYGTSLLYQSIIKQKIDIEKVVVASSQFVYGQGRWRCAQHGVSTNIDRQENDLKLGKFDPVCQICKQTMDFIPHTEDYSDPQNAYSISKYTQELIGLKLGKLWGIPTTALRYSIVHGARQSLKSAYSGALRQFVLWLSRNEPFTLFEDGKQLRDFVSVKDVASANVFCLKNSITDYENYNVGGKNAYTVTQLAQMVQKEMGVSSPITYPSYWRPGDSRHSVSDISKFAAVGFFPSIDEKENIADFVTWARENRFEGANVKNIIRGMVKKGLLKG